jgi:hypothetical protein
MSALSTSAAGQAVFGRWTAKGHGMSTPHDRAALRAAGLSDLAIDSKLRRGELVAVTKGALIPASLASSPLARCAAALSTQHPGAAVSHRTSAVIKKFRWIPATWLLDDQPIDVIAPPYDVSRSRRNGLNRRLAALPPEDVVTEHGLRITTAARTLIDLARTEPRWLVLQIADGALTDGFCEPADLTAVCERMTGLRDVRRARDIARLARVGVDSPRETTTRLLILDAGLPEPDVHLEIKEDELLLACGDLGYWRWLIWIEYDGFAEHGDQPSFGGDRFKDRWLHRRGWEPMRVSARDHADPADFLGQLAQAISEAPARIAALDPRRSPEVAAAQALLFGAADR